MGRHCNIPTLVKLKVESHQPFPPSSSMQRRSNATMTSQQHFKSHWFLALAFCWLTTPSATHADPALATNSPAIIPAPQQLTVQPGTFSLQTAHHTLVFFSHGGTKIMAD